MSDVPDTSVEKVVDVKSAICSHEVLPGSLTYTKLGRKGICAKCGIVLILYREAAPRSTPKVHMSKKERLAKRRLTQ